MIGAMRMREVVAVVAVVLVAGCGGGGDGGGGGDEIDYYESMREIAAFSNSSDAELDDLADSVCELVDQITAAGGTNEDAADAIFQTGLDSGFSEADALVVALTVVGANCPIDIRE